MAEFVSPYVLEHYADFLYNMLRVRNSTRDRFITTLVELRKRWIQAYGDRRIPTHLNLELYQLSSNGPTQDTHCTIYLGVDMCDCLLCRRASAIGNYHRQPILSNYPSQRTLIERAATVATDGPTTTTPVESSSSEDSSSQ